MPRLTDRLLLIEVARELGILKQDHNLLSQHQQGEQLLGSSADKTQPPMPTLWRSAPPSSGADALL
jgi:hypothetical protein